MANLLLECYAAKMQARGLIKKPSNHCYTDDFTGTIGRETVALTFAVVGSASADYQEIDMTSIVRVTIIWVCAISLTVFLLVSCATEPLSVREPVDETGSDVRYFPPHPKDGEWQSITAAEAGFNAAGLEEALKYAESQRSSGVIMLFDGRIVAERYWHVPEPESSNYENMVVAQNAEGRAIEDVASVQKSVVSLLAGIAEGKGLLDLSAPVSLYLGEGWSKATTEQEGEITVEHLLSMTSGLLTDLTFEAPAGEKWFYNTNVYSRVLPVLEAASGLSVERYTAEWLTVTTGMKDSGWIPRPWVTSGMDANVLGFGTTARDLARLGLLVLRDGQWNGTDILGNPGYIERATKSSQDLNPAYGYLWWLNGQERGIESGRVVEGPIIPSAPDDLYAAIGAFGRKVYVVPSMMLVVTRLGDSPGQGFDDEFWRLLMAATL